MERRGYMGNTRSFSEVGARTRDQGVHLSLRNACKTKGVGADPQFWNLSPIGATQLIGHLLAELNPEVQPSALRQSRMSERYRQLSQFEWVNSTLGWRLVPKRWQY